MARTIFSLSGDLVGRLVGIGKPVGGLHDAMIAEMAAAGLKAAATVTQLRTVVEFMEARFYVKFSEIQDSNSYEFVLNDAIPAKPTREEMVAFLCGKLKMDSDLFAAWPDAAVEVMYTAHAPKSDDKPIYRLIVLVNNGEIDKVTITTREVGELT